MGELRKKYTDKDIQTIISCVEKSPENISKGLAKAATLLGRTESSLQKKYYSSIRNEQIILTVVSNEEAYPGKNKPRTQSTASNPLFIAAIDKYDVNKLSNLLDKVLDNDTKAEIILAMIATM